MSNRRKMLGAAGACLAAVPGYILARTRAALPRTGGEIGLRDLDHAVEVRFDRWGVPHIDAHTLADALFAQGYVAAQDRMIQMEIARRVASGRLSEVMGKTTLELDRFMRNLVLCRTAERIAAALPTGSALFLERYAAGVNAYLCDRRRTLPVGLRLVAAGRPSPWTPRDCLLAMLLFHWTMDATWTADLMRGRLVRRMGAEAAKRLLAAGGQGNVPLPSAEGEKQRFPTIDPPPECELDFLAHGEGWPEWMSARVNVGAQGSNAWAVSGRRSITGKPLLCNDPHLLHGLPTCFYLCHLRAQDPPCDFAGACIPGVPGVLAGRNASIAWGVARLAADTTDVFVETFTQGETNRYLHEGSWKEAETIEEEIKAFPGRSVKHQVMITSNGPVIARCGEKALALKWVGHDAENDSVGCLVRMGLATNWKEFVRALEGYAGPALSLVYADVDGNIAYHAAGRIPVREGHDGSVPLPGGSASPGWSGYLGLEDLPHDLNPHRGWIAATNTRIVDGDCPHLISTLWGPPFRQERLAEMLSASHEHDRTSMGRMQGDLYTGRGAFLRREMLLAAGNWKEVSPQAAEALRLLQEWDCRADAYSVAQSISHVTWRVLAERLLRHRLGHELFFEYVTSFPSLSHVLEEIVAARDGEWLPPAAGSYEELMRQCLEESLSRLAAYFRTYDMRKWRWGPLHRLEIPHPFSFLKPLGRLLSLGPVPHGGDEDTVCCSPAGSDPAVQLPLRSSLGGTRELAALPHHYSYRACAGPVFRMIVDFSHPDASLWSLDAGQCSNPLSPFYRNFFPEWRRLEYAPMAFSPKKVGEVTHSVLRLSPRR